MRPLVKAQVHSCLSCAMHAVTTPPAPPRAGAPAPACLLTQLSCVVSPPRLGRAVGT